MDELITEFLIETKEGILTLDRDLINLEKNPDDKEIIGNLFRVIHTIKGTCGFLGLVRLEHVAHAGEDVMDKVRSGEIRATPEIISAILCAVDHIKSLLTYLEENGIEQEGDDSALIAKIKAPLTVTKTPITVNQIIQEAQEKPPETAKTDEPEQKIDSDDLQALFDSTPCLVDIQEPIAPPVQKKPTHIEKPNENEAHKKPATGPATIRVTLNILEELMQHASELVLTRNQLLQLLRSNDGGVFAPALQRLNNITTELQEGVMKTRMQPVGSAWTKLPRIVRDLSIELGKKIELNMEGEETELDRQLLEMIGDPLTHMVRNSADHGIEKPEIRKELGKPETGTINIRAYHGSGYIIIEISDDGRGIDPEIIKKKAIEKGLISESTANNINKNQILQFIFAAGFSTAEQITSVSGRGVGMDVVKNNIEKIGGTVDLESEVGKGSQFTIRIPLTLAIMPILKLEVEGHKFAIPQINIREVVRTGPKSAFNIESLDGRPELRLRGRLVPLVDLAKVLGLDVNKQSQGNFVIICELGNYSFGIIVDRVLDTEEIVVKSVSPLLKSISVYSGSTILGDGSVILILEPNSLAKSSGEMATSGQNFLNNEDKVDDDLQKSSFVIFQAGDNTPKIAPLELLSRLEEIDVCKIEYSRGVPVIQYRGELMRLVSIDPAYKFPAEGIQQLLVVNEENLYMGLVVERIIDIIKAPVKQKISGGTEGFLGALVIEGKTCDVIDISYYFRKTFKNHNKDTENKNEHTQKNVLLVDDSPFFRKFIPPGLESEGFTVTTASNGKDALFELERSKNYVAIITDITMPGMNGQELAHLCRQKPYLKNIPIIALSADRDGTEHFEKWKIEGIDAFIPKTNHSELVNTLQTLIKTKEQA